MLGLNMNKREGFMRLFIGLPFVLVFWLFLSWFIVAAMILYGFIDILWQTLLGSEGLGSSNAIKDLWMWGLKNTDYTAFGSGSFQATPY